MSFNYLTNSSGFTRIAAYVGQLVDSAVDMRIEAISQSFSSRSGQSMPKSPVRIERADVADNRALNARRKAAANGDKSSSLFPRALRGAELHASG